MAPAAAHVDRAAGPRRGGPHGPAAATAPRPGGGRRHRAAVCRRERGADASLPGPCLGSAWRRVAGAGARGIAQGGADGGAGRGHGRTGRQHVADQDKRRRDRPLAPAGLALWPATRLHAPAHGPGVGQRTRPHQPSHPGSAGRAALDHSRVAAAVCPRTERHRTKLAGPQAAPLGPPHVQGRRTQVANLPSYFSNVVRIKEGLKVIERLPFSQVKQERWGDYTGIQYKYNEPGTIWLVGSFGNESKLNGTWIGKLKVKDNISVDLDLSLKAFPNPISATTTLGFVLDKNETIKAQLYDVSGKMLNEIFNGELPAGYNELSFNGAGLAHGTYYIFIKESNGNKKFSAKLIR